MNPPEHPADFQDFGRPIRRLHWLEETKVRGQQDEAVEFAG